MTQSIADAGESSPKPNHLAGEKSPYLLQHAYNPVDWHPWGPEAFEKARKENKPIFLSIGYSTCHWCHVMERESFSDPKIGALLNENFVPIKVDREERPEVDHLYMTAVQALSGSGGWPLNVFLTPDLKPFYGGTYFPREPRFGLPSFDSLLRRVAGLWGTDREKLSRSSDEVLDAIRRHAEPESGAIPGVSALEDFYKSYSRGFKDWLYRASPKFPLPSNQNFLLRYYVRTGSRQALEEAVATLRAIVRGGLRDQLGGGFHRYSTDERWHVPHFEKMLYDNAQLAVNLIEAYQATHDEELGRAARETLDYLEREMAHPEGGFYSAEDADSLPASLAGKVSSEGFEHKAEGAYYVWETSEIEGILGKPAARIFNFRFGAEEGGNAGHDPHGEFPNKNILYQAHSIAETAKKFGKPEGEVSALLEDSRKKLLEARSERPRPHLDDKILSSWNGLALSAFAKASAAFGDPEFLARAEKNAAFLKKHLYDAKSRRLYRRWREGERKVQGMADDYAFVTQGLLDLYEADFDVEHLRWAIELSETQVRLFYDEKHGGFFTSSLEESRSLLIRSKTDYDNVEPAAGSVAAMNFLRLVRYVDREDFRKIAEKTLGSFSRAMKETPRAVPQMLCALDFYLAQPQEIVIAGDPAAIDTQEMLRAVNEKFLPYKSLILADGGKGQAFLAERLPNLKGMVPLHGKATAYVCVHLACDLPTTSLETFRTLLEGKRPSFSEPR